MTPLIYRASDKLKAFTLLELLCTLAISGLLISMSVPLVNTAWNKDIIHVAADQTLNMLNYARTESILRNSAVIVCLSSDNLTCTQDEMGLNVIALEIDSNTLLRTLNLPSKVQSHYSGFNRHYLGIVYHPTGHASNNGTFSLGIKGVHSTTQKEKPLIYKVIVSKSGRSRIEHT